jgi:toxin ParE1/3/4
VTRSEIEVRLLRIAEDDLREIISYVQAERPSAADAIGSKIEKNIMLLSRNPWLGMSAKEPHLAEMGYRYLVIDNYLVFYQIEESAIFIHRIVHGARDYVILL